MRAPVLGLGHHRLESVDLVAQGDDLAVDALEGVGEDPAALDGVLGRPEPVAVPLAGRLVLEELADVREGEPGVVAQAADEPQALEVLGVVEAVGALGAGGGGEEADLLVVADRSRGQAGVLRDLLDPEESGGSVGHRACNPTRTLPFT